MCSLMSLITHILPENSDIDWLMGSHIFDYWKGRSKFLFTTTEPPQAVDAVGAARWGLS